MKGTIATTTGAVTALLRSNLTGSDTGHRDLAEKKFAPFKISDTDHLIIKGGAKATGSISVDDGAIQGVKVTNRNLKTGQDVGKTTEVAPGDSFDYATAEDEDVVVMPMMTTGATADVGTIGEPTDEKTATKVAEAESNQKGSATDGPTGEQAAEPTDASDDEVKAEIAALSKDPANMTNAGVVNVTALNAALAAKGFKPVTADRRDALVA